MTLRFPPFFKVFGKGCKRSGREALCVCRLDVNTLSAAAKTTQEIQAAYQSMDNKCADFEYAVLDFVKNILDLAGTEENEEQGEEYFRKFDERYQKEYAAYQKGA